MKSLVLVLAVFISSGVATAATAKYECSGVYSSTLVTLTFNDFSRVMMTDTYGDYGDLKIVSEESNSAVFTYRGYFNIPLAHSVSDVIFKIDASALRAGESTVHGQFQSVGAGTTQAATCVKK